MCYYPFIINLDRCNGSCNVLGDPSGRICVTNKTKDVNINAFNMITRINETKALTKYISCKCKYNSYEKCNNEKC